MFQPLFCLNSVSSSSSDFRKVIHTASSQKILFLQLFLLLLLLWSNFLKAVTSCSLGQTCRTHMHVIQTGQRVQNESTRRRMFFLDLLRNVGTEWTQVAKPPHVLLKAGQNKRFQQFSDTVWTRCASSLLPAGTDLLQVAAHEFGHVLGLQHSHKPKTIMYEYYSFSYPLKLSEDDKQGIQYLYGAKPRVVAPRPTTPPPPPPPPPPHVYTETNEIPVSVTNATFEETCMKEAYGWVWVFKSEKYQKKCGQETDLWLV